ncbi:FHA domain-containing protein [Aureliella helgolandensis]|uniref:FHA domain-containing protein FhaA n=1 Tax=Aureliella helgolandensis TaxID=2527968 RepID=A0A518GEZ3_9BACT|nr:FHA domain-containing protein [Aureliella helgolandensis]QDV27171.1 FHA domain-containing protein FhaA [Aureliella helgolandensis]
MQMQLKVVTGGHSGKLISVNHDKFLIGRSDECHLRPKSESISRRHCAIIRKDGRILLIDLKSRNGTLVNDKKLDPARAKILKDGDHIRVGKLEFIAVIEAGVSNVKKPEVKDVKDAAARTAENTGDSRYDEVSVSSWLEEADQIERSQDDPETRQFHIAESKDIPESTIMELKAEEETKSDVAKGKSKPGKLPPIPKGPQSGNSKDAASETLRKFFSGR